MFGFSAINFEDYISPAMYCDGPDGLLNAVAACSDCSNFCYNNCYTGCTGTNHEGLYGSIK